MSEAESPSPTNHLHFQESFLKAKRNVMWASAVCILVFLTNFGDATQLVNLPLSNSGIPRDIAQALLAIYCAYLLALFEFERKRQLLLNSGALYSKDVADLKNRLGDFKQNLEKTLTKIRDLNESIIEKEVSTLYELVKNASHHRSQLEGLVDVHNKDAPKLDQLQTMVNRYFKNPNPDDPAASSMLAHEIQSQLSEFRHAIKNSAEKILIVIDYLENLVSSRDRLTDGNALHSWELSDTVETIGKIETSMHTLESSIADSDKAKSLFLDQIPSYGLGLIAIAVSIMHFVLKYWIEHPQFTAKVSEI